MDFAYSCGLTDYSTAWLEIWVLYTGTIWKGRTQFGDAAWLACRSPLARGGTEWGVGNYKCQARGWKVMPQGLEGGEGHSSLERVSAQEGSVKEGHSGQEMGQKETVEWKMPRVSVCASDFSSQRKKKKQGESPEGPPLPVVLMPLDGKKKKKSMCLRIKARPSKADSFQVCLSDTPVAKSSSNTFVQLLT